MDSGASIPPTDPATEHPAGSQTAVSGARPPLRRTLRPIAQLSTIEEPSTGAVCAIDDPDCAAPEDQEAAR